MERGIPVLYKRKEECCGCTACYAICPKEAISMLEDEEGFEYPKIDEKNVFVATSASRSVQLKKQKHSKEI